MMKHIKEKLKNFLQKHTSVEETENANGSLITKIITMLGNRKKALLIAVSVLAIVSVVLAGGFLLLRESGKNSLYGDKDSNKPNLNKEEESESFLELDINPDEMDQIEVVENQTENESAAQQDGNGEEPENQSGEETKETQENATQQVSQVQSETTVQKPGPSNGQQSITNVSQNNGSDMDAIELEADVENGNNETSFQVGAPGNIEEYDVIYNGKKYAYNKDIINLLVLGIDKRETVSPAKDGISGGQSDAIFILSLNPKTKIMDMIAIPRDTITKIDLYDRAGNYTYSGYAQICLQHGYGDGMTLSNERAKKAVSELLYDLPIHSVTSINMGAMGQINDAIGGITLNSLYTFYDEGYQFVKGQPVTLKGNLAYSYVHYRDTSRHYTAPERLERQKQYMLLFIEKAMNKIHENVGTVVEVYNAVKDYVVTDLKIDDMTYLASELRNYTFGEIHTLEGQVDTSRKYERYYLDKDALYRLIIRQFYEEVK